MCLLTPELALSYTDLSMCVTVEHLPLGTDVLMSIQTGWHPAGNNLLKNNYDNAQSLAAVPYGWLSVSLSCAATWLSALSGNFPVLPRLNVATQPMATRPRHVLFFSCSLGTIAFIYLSHDCRPPRWRGAKNDGLARRRTLTDDAHEVKSRRKKRTSDNNRTIH